MIGLALAGAALVLALIPALVFRTNLRLYRRLPGANAGVLPAISVLIPARDEEQSIVSAVEAALANRSVELEVIVFDDRSEDATAKLVMTVAARDARLRLLEGPPLPLGWCGKQHACWALAQAARHPLLVFLDADLRLAPDAVARMTAFLDASGADLISGVPQQETGTFAEKLLIPLIHFILLGFLPLRRMRASTHPAYAAGCGQLFMVRRSAYDEAGGHAAIRETLHDGLRLPRLFRAAGRRTDLFDATDVAVCRMYRGAGEVWRGLAKNASEGLGSPRLIVPASLLLLGGQLLPALLLVAAPWLSWPARVLALAAAGAAWYPRLAGLVRFRQSPLGALLHPLGVTVLVVVQWYALAGKLLGRPACWKGRQYTAASDGSLARRSLGRVSMR